MSQIPLSHPSQAGAREDIVKALCQVGEQIRKLYQRKVYTLGNLVLVGRLVQDEGPFHKVPQSSEFGDSVVFFVGPTRSSPVPHE